MSPSPSRAKLVAQSSTAKDRLFSKALTLGTSASSSRSDVTPPTHLRQVRLSDNVEVIPIRCMDDFLAASDSCCEMMGEECAGTLRLVRNEVRSVRGEQLTCMSAAGGERVAVGSAGGNIYIMESTGLPIFTSHIHDFSISAVEFVGKYRFVSVGEDSLVVEWTHDPQHRAPGFQGRIITQDLQDSIRSVRVVKDNPDVVVTGGTGGVLRFYGGESGAISSITVKSSVTCMEAFGSTIATGCRDGSVGLWDARTGTSRYSYNHKEQVASLTCTPNGSLFASGAFDATVSLIDPRSMVAVGSLKCLGGPATALSVSSNGLAVCAGEELLLYDLRKLSDPRYRRERAWKGTGRGVYLLDAAATDAQLDLAAGDSPSPLLDMLVIVAASDGYFRFYRGW